MMNAYDLADRKHYDQIDALKGIAIFLVVLGHSIILYPVNLHENIVCNFIFRWLSSVHIPLFFTVSGFCFSYNGSYKTYIWKKVKRIMIPYLIFNIIDIAPRYLFPDMVNRPRGIGESLKRILFNGGEYWFLYTLFIIFLFFPFVYKGICKNICGLLAAMIVILGLYYCMPLISVFVLSDVVYYLFYFMLGVLMKQFWGNKLFKNCYNKFKTINLIIILSIMWGVLVNIDISYLSVITALVGILTIYLCAQFETVVVLFKRFGKYSLQLYLLNGYLLVISRTIIVSILGVNNPVIIIVFNMLIDFGVSYIFIKYLCERINCVKILMGM